jgi:hypothetical protein
MFAVRPNTSAQWTPEAAEKIPAEPVQFCAHSLTPGQLVDVLAPAALFVINHLLTNFPSFQPWGMLAALRYRTGCELDVEAAARGLLAGVNVHNCSGKPAREERERCYRIVEAYSGLISDQKTLDIMLREIRDGEPDEACR